MQRTLDTLDDEITGAVDTHVAELETLLRTDRTGGPAGGTAETAGPSAPPEDEPPPLPPLDDIPALKGTTEWAEAVVERYPRLTVDEVLAIYHYTTVDGVDEMNGHLRHPENTPEAARAAIQQRIDAAVSGLKKLPKVPGVTFRGTYIPEDILPDWRAGARVSDAAFYSSSTDAAVAEDFRLSRDGNVFVTITGATGVDVQALSHFGDEAEILFQPGTEWRVITAEWDERRTCWDLDVVEVTR
ncbi:ADP-ribosyltransferase domain-containing protein [Haloactinopolyspora alba]|nr:ADP-ribosyltransferase domain-containing protein [Haloactinopolyspora alba]